MCDRLPISRTEAWLSRAIGGAVILMVLSAHYAGCKAHANSVVRITTCTLSSENATQNNRSEMIYYECNGENFVAFALREGSTGELRLRQSVGKVVDIGIEEVGR